MADVASTLAGWSSTTSSNTPADTATIGSGLAGNLREIQGVLVRGLSHKGADIASAATTDLGAVEGLAHDITGSTTVSSFGTGRAGLLKLIQFDGALTLTHNASSLILPGGANITTAAGDVAIMFSEGSGNWRCYGYFRTANQPTQDASDTVKGVIEISAQSEQETGTSTTLAVTPGRQHFHPSAAKAWADFGNTGNVNTSYNVTSVTDTGTGQATVNWATDFAAANYSVVATLEDGTDLFPQIGSKAGGTSLIRAVDASSGALADPSGGYNVAAFGDQS